MSVSQLKYVQSVSWGLLSQPATQSVGICSVSQLVSQLLFKRYNIITELKMSVLFYSSKFVQSVIPLDFVESVSKLQSGRAWSVSHLFGQSVIWVLFR